ncbi:hypothetical protein, partial [Enterobacter hormaechei]|uniref:hypothetical protein n=1 Tax=Enterobacter hormaechei TaxID=158836 RepID=UPI0013FD1C04
DHVTNTGQPNRAPRYNDSDPLVGHDYSSVTYTGCGQLRQPDRDAGRALRSCDQYRATEPGAAL